MANHGYQIHALCLFAMMMSKGSSLSFPNQNLVSLQDLSLLWFMDQFNQRPSIDMTDLSPLQCRSFLVMSILWNRDVLPWRRFVSGAFFRYRWIFRLSTGDCPLTQGYGGFTWVFDPGINRVLAEDEEIVKLVIERIIPACLMETKKKSHTQWVTSRGQDLDNLERLSPILNKSTSGLWLHPLRYCWIVIWRLHVNMIKYWLDSFNKPWEDKEESVMMAGIYDRLIVVATNKSTWDRIERKWKSNYFRMTLIQNPRYHVNISELFSEASGFIMRCALWSFSKEMLLTHTFRIRGRSEMVKENNGLNDSLANKTYLRKASSISPFYCVFFSLLGAYICLCNNLFSKVLFDFVISI